ncbi:uncharacterized protein LOC127008451 [Eriocheir sinensis]|uniref:uncharacterized protein LOC127008451 n=1 Tax=Eriocheir sinensis TaxID=95602 RepID=UPI0021C70152|nr:uncharacterized protein LOC127008451 [Eriocheir sinensis]
MGKPRRTKLGSPPTAGRRGGSAPNRIRRPPASTGSSDCSAHNHAPADDGMAAPGSKDTESTGNTRVCPADSDFDSCYSPATVNPTDCVSAAADPALAPATASTAATNPAPATTDPAPAPATASTPAATDIAPAPATTSNPAPPPATASTFAATAPAPAPATASISTPTDPAPAPATASTTASTTASIPASTDSTSTAGDISSSATFVTNSQLTTADGYILVRKKGNAQQPACRSHSPSQPSVTVTPTPRTQSKLPAFCVPAQPEFPTSYDAVAALEDSQPTQDSECHGNRWIYGHRVKELNHRLNITRRAFRRRPTSPNRRYLQAVARHTSTIKQQLRDEAWVQCELRRGHGMAVFIDLEKAFELASPLAILTALARKGVRGRLLSWMKSWLCSLLLSV